MDSSDPGQGHVSGSCEHGNEPSGLIKCGEFSGNVESIALQGGMCST